MIQLMTGPTSDSDAAPSLEQAWFSVKIFNIAVYFTAYTKPWMH
jgi:hypothetical protein